MTCSNKVDMLFWLLINSISFFAFQGSHHRSIEIKKRRRENWRQDLLYLKRHQKKKKEILSIKFFRRYLTESANNQGHWIKMHRKLLKATTKFSLKRIPPFRVTLGLLLIMANSGKILQEILQQLIVKIKQGFLRYSLLFLIR